MDNGRIVEKTLENEKTIEKLKLENDFQSDLSPEQLEENNRRHEEIRKDYINTQVELNNQEKINPELKKLLRESDLPNPLIINERNDRISHLIAPDNEKQFEQNLMWMTQQGTEKDFLLILKLQKNCPYPISNKLSYFFKKALEKCKPSFSSFKQIKKHHNDLLKEYRSYQDEKNSQELQSKIENFVHQIETAGLYLYEENERFAAQSLLNYWITRLYRMGYDELDITLAEYDPSLAPELTEQDYPYVGLKPFTENDNQHFYGRETLINESITRLKESSLLAITGSAKIGKSSLVFAGILPKLKTGAIEGSDNWYYYPTITPGNKPLEHLAQIIKPDANEGWIQQQVAEFKTNPQHFCQSISNAHSDRPVVLVIDRFEELFTLCFDREERQAFVENLVKFIEASNTQHFLIFTICSDFIWKIDQIRNEKFQELLSKSQVKVDFLKDSELKEVIEKPAESIGLKFDRGLVDTLVKDFSGELDALPLLQFTLLKLWESRERDRVTWDSYKQLGIGGGRLALSNSAKKFYESLSDIEQKTCRLILLRLVRSTQGFKPMNPQVKRQELYQLATPEISISNIEEVLDRLVSENLVCKSSGKLESDDRFEIARESLIRHWSDLRDWMNQDRENLLQRLRLIDRSEEWQEKGKDKSLLLKGSVLEAYKNLKCLSTLEQEFIDSSIQEENC
ncbi:ATP-binding protein [Oscillatoria salina]|uniref:ATP-binding protein n=1 Tax=Oscillatoria salina TaxID=331517 RepID=UPI0013B8ABF4|nr:ATP-binding protein [Oscillatoria salina]MBZ8178957.1 ATP-binding protein [Oscillatoria salina IIICB1]NET89414.1 ATP-binding protein [Kamptonema sp. SIO1D9]